MTARWLRLLFVLLMCVPAVAAGEAPKQQLEEIMQREPYQRWRLRQKRAAYRGRGWELSESTRKALKDMVDRIGKALDHAVRWIFRGRTPNAGGDWDLPDFSSVLDFLRLAGWILLAVLSLFLLYILFLFLRGRRFARPSARVVSREHVRTALEQGDALELESPQWLEEAERLAGEKEFRAVYRALYLALLSGLHSRGVIDFRRNRTNWTYVARYRGPKETRTTFSELTTLFDDVWYGLRSPKDASIEGVRNDVTTLLNQEAVHERT